MKEGYWERGKCQETREEESGNGIRNGGQRRKERGEIEGKSMRGEWEERWRTASGKEGEKRPQGMRDGRKRRRTWWKEREVKDSGLIR